jgi:hypothetical protein
MFRILTLAMVAGAVLVGSAEAQDKGGAPTNAAPPAMPSPPTKVVPPVNVDIGQFQRHDQPERKDAFVRVQINVNLFVPGPTDESEDAAKLRDGAQRAMYGVAARQCDLLREVLAKDCRLESMNVNLNANANRGFGQQQDGYNVQGSMSLQITLK